MFNKNQSPVLSVIVPVYNGGNFLRSSLTAINNSDYRAVEVIVANDGSTDASAEISRGLGAQVINSPQPQSGPAAARNAAAEIASGEFLVFIDADVVVKKDSLGRIVKAFRANQGISALFGSYDAAPGAANFLSQYRNLLHHYVHQNSSPEASTFWAGLGAVRRTTFAEIGGFDAEQYARPSIEDIELGMRLRASGHRILLDKNIQATHLKKWTMFSMLRTDIFSRAIPWARLILTRKALINDLNLKKTDRLSALFVGLLLVFSVIACWQPLFLIPVFLLISGCLYLDRRIIRFFAAQRGVTFAAGAFVWHLIYFFYSGASFVFSWIEVNISALLDDSFLSSGSTRSN